MTGVVKIVDLTSWRVQKEMSRVRRRIIIIGWGSWLQRQRDCRLRVLTAVAYNNTILNFLYLRWLAWVSSPWILNPCC